MLGLAAVGGLAFCWVGTRNLVAAVAMFTVLTFFDRLPGVAKSSLTVTKLGGAALMGLWVLALWRGRPAVTPVFSRHPALGGAVASLAVWTLVSAFWAPSFSLAVSTAFRLVQGLVLMIVAWSTVRRREHLWWIMAAFVVGALLTSVVSIGSTTAQAGDRLAGDFGDPNELASVIVPAMVFASATVLLRRGWIRGAALLALPLLLRALVRTDSRGGLVALAVALVAAGVLAGPVRRRVLPVVVVCGVVGILWVFVLSPGGRVQGTAADRGSGRLDLWHVATMVIADHPLVGVGAGNFPEVEPPYALRNVNLPRVDLVVKPEVAHNTYLEILAELGIIGGLVYASVVVGSLALAGRAFRVARRHRALEVDVIARALVVAILAVLTAQTFLTFQYEKQFWLLLGVAAATLTVARLGPDAPADEFKRGSHHLIPA